MPVISWIKNNKLSSFLLLVIIVFLTLSSVKNSIGINGISGGVPTLMMDQTVSGGTESFGPVAKSAMMAPINQDYTPQPGITNRMVVENSYLSLLVKDVTSVKDAIITYAQTNGGYMVDSNVSNPQDAPSATVTIRVQSAKLKEALAYLHSLSVKVVSENLQGTDVTDQYVDVEKRITLLENTKAKFETILTTAKEISDITNVTREILNYQDQIDSLKGSQMALEKNAQLAKITVYLSTDEIALPYAPSEMFRPNVIFKLAVRSLVGILRNIGTMVIWVAVYAVIWVPVLVVLWFLKKRFTK